MEYKDYYQILGIGRDATQDQIKQAYRKLAEIPSRRQQGKDAEARFKDAGEAYEVLKDPRNGPPMTSSAPTGKTAILSSCRPTGMPASNSARRYTGGDASGFSDFFESLFGHDHATGRRQQTFRMRGEDQHAQNRHPAGRRSSRPGRPSPSPARWSTSPGM